MDKRILLFWVLATAVWFGWMTYENSRQPSRKLKRGDDTKVAQVDSKAPKPAAKDAAEKKEGAEKKPDADSKSDGKASKPDEKSTKDAKDSASTPTEIKPAAPARPAVPLRTDMVLGDDSPGSDAKYDIFARFTNRGAGVYYLHLNKYENEHRKGPLVLLSEETPGQYSFLFYVKGDFASQLEKKNWEVVESSNEKIVFRTTALNDKLVVEKHFSLKPGRPFIELSIVLKNVSDQPIPKLEYAMSGGNGLPIEGRWYTNYYRKLVAIVVPETGAAPFLEEQDVTEIVSNAEAKKPKLYSGYPIRLGGIVDQYFASLVIQKANPLEDRVIASIAPLFVQKAKESHFSNIAVQLNSQPLEIKAGAALKHEFALYNGPKRAETLAQYPEYDLPLVIHYPNTFYLPIGPVAKALVWVLNQLYSLTSDYGVAIILLTVLVRTCMFPLSFRQAISMQKIQALQPKMQEIREKYADDIEKQHRELRAFQTKHNINPLGGCLPVLLQFPIFIGLWQSLYNSFSLRQSTFFYNLTWIKDLSAPDQMFPFPWDVPFLGPYFNLLPIFAVIQMVVQVKMSSPPATNPEQALQQKTMTYMMVFMGFMFYKVPAGLCVYIITSGAWSMLERKFLPKAPANPAVADPTMAAESEPATRDASSWLTPIDKKKRGKSRR